MFVTNEQRSQCIKSKIAAAAKKLFFARGYCAVTISDIAAEAHVSRVTLFKYFGSKEDLASAVAHQITQERIVHSEEVMADKSLSFRQKFDLMVSTKKEYRLSMNDELMASPVWRDAMFAKIFSAAMREDFRRHMSGFVKEGKKEGAFAKDIPTDALVDYMDFFYGYMMQNDILSKDSKYHLALIDILCYGIFAESK